MTAPSCQEATIDREGTFTSISLTLMPQGVGNEPKTECTIESDLPSEVWPHTTPGPTLGHTFTKDGNLAWRLDPADAGDLVQLGEDATYIFDTFEILTSQASEEATLREQQLRAVTTAITQHMS